MKQFSIVGDTPTKIAYVLSPPGYINAYVLTANIPQNVAVPEGSGIAIFSGNADFYVNWRDTAAVPAANVTDGTGSELNPGARYLEGISMFSIIAPAAAIVTIQFYANK
jgi:hypothetical protein